MRSALRDDLRRSAARSIVAARGRRHAPVGRRRWIAIAAAAARSCVALVPAPGGSPASAAALGSRTRRCRSSQQIVERIQVPAGRTRELGRVRPGATDRRGRARAIRSSSSSRPKFAREITITSEPPGATVSARYYDDPDAPAARHRHDAAREGASIRCGFTRLRLELRRQGAGVDDVIWNFGLVRRCVELHACTQPGEVPNDMAWIPAGTFATVPARARRI